MAERAQRTLSIESRHDKDYAVSSHSSDDGRSIPRSPSLRMASPQSSHRHSFSDQLRGVPPSPRSSRHFSQSSVPAVQDLLNNPPKANAADPAFTGRDWHSISVNELVDAKDVHWVEVDTGIEEATNVRWLVRSLANQAKRSAESDRDWSPRAPRAGGIF